MRALALFSSHTAVWAQPATGLGFWGLGIYDASLWVAPGFRDGEFARHAFVLELAYLRAFTGAEIAGTAA